MILGIDSSLNSTGYAVLDNNKIVCYGCIKNKQKELYLNKMLNIERELKEIVKKKKVDYIIIEDLAVCRNMVTTKELAGLIYHLELEFTKWGIKVEKVKPTLWRKGKIKGKKREELKSNAIEYIKNKYNLIVNDDEADSIIIAEYGGEYNG